VAAGETTPGEKRPALIHDISALPVKLKASRTSGRKYHLVRRKFACQFVETSTNIVDRSSA
jgi:hypothetical protein